MIGFEQRCAVFGCQSYRHPSDGQPSAWPRRWREGHGGVAWDRRLRPGQPLVECVEDRNDPAVSAEGELQAAAALDYPRGAVHQLLDHGADAPAHRPVAQRCARPRQPFLAQIAQDVVGKHRAGEHQAIGGKLARGQAFDVQVALELAVEL